MRISRVLVWFLLHEMRIPRVLVTIISRGCLLQLSPILHGNNCFCAHSMICFNKTCVGRLLGELHRSRETETTTILFPKVYRLANVVQTPHQEVKVEQSVLIGLLETGCLLNLYTTLAVRLHKHLWKGNPFKVSKGSSHLSSAPSLASGAAYRSSNHTDHEHLGLFAMVQSIQHQGRCRWHRPLAHQN